MDFQLVQKEQKWEESRKIIEKALWILFQLQIVQNTNTKKEEKKLFFIPKITGKWGGVEHKKKKNESPRKTEQFENLRKKLFRFNTWATPAHI